MNYKTTNVKIVGGVKANPNSWPWIALVLIRYKFYVKYENQYFIESVSYMCGASLIDRKTLLTAGHCLLDKVYFNGQIVIVEPNSFYPTLGSMYTVFLGIHNVTQAKTGAKLTSGIAMNVSRFIRVKNIE